VRYRRLLTTYTRLILYGTGADISFADCEVVEELLTRSRRKKYGFRSLVPNGPSGTSLEQIARRHRLTLKASRKR
jgi:hypothetical protein